MWSAEEHWGVCGWKTLLNGLKWTILNACGVQMIEGNGEPWTLTSAMRWHQIDDERILEMFWSGLTKSNTELYQRKNFLSPFSLRNQKMKIVVDWARTSNEPRLHTKDCYEIDTSLRKKKRQAQRSMEKISWMRNKGQGLVFWEICNSEHKTDNTSTSYLRPYVKGFATRNKYIIKEVMTSLKSLTSSCPYSWCNLKLPYLHLVSCVLIGWAHTCSFLLLNDVCYPPMSGSRKQSHNLSNNSLDC